MKTRIEQWVLAFDIHDTLRAHLAEVVLALPDPIRDDLVNDEAFRLCEYEPGFTMTVPMCLGVSQRTGRAVALRRSLRHRHADFIRYVIAHELAHVHLRNEGRHPGEDPEFAADALAALWGFPRP
ncbi:MAG: hypothetical protein K8S99_15275 [Planctomycetes bacterium]|nr:hypothetical protein [Planctomycetota bacterium]